MLQAIDVEFVNDQWQGSVTHNVVGTNKYRRFKVGVSNSLRQLVEELQELGPISIDGIKYDTYVMLSDLAAVLMDVEPWDGRVCDSVLAD